MSSVNNVQLLVIFSACGFFLLNALNYYTSKIKLFPDVIWMLLLGVGYSLLAYSFASEIPSLTLNADLVLYIFVPLLVFASAQKMCLSHFKKVLAPASLIASLGIIISMIVIALPLHYFLGFGVIESLLFGAIVSATDPLAVGAIISGNKDIPESQKLLIEGESILNDGFVVTVFGVLSALLFSSETLSLGQSVIGLFSHIFGAIIIGIFIGRFARWLLHRWHEKHFILTVNMTLTVAYSSFFIGEHFEFSGILTVFAAALAYGYKPEQSAHNQDVHGHLWEYFEYISNSILFFMLGASLLVFFSWQSISALMLMIVLVLLVLSRFLSLSLLKPLIYINGKKLTSKEFYLLNFSGARGAVSIALILLLPDSFALKKEFLSLAFVMIFTSLICYPLVMQRILKK